MWAENLWVSMRGVDGSGLLSRSETKTEVKELQRV